MRFFPPTGWNGEKQAKARFVVKERQVERNCHLCNMSESDDKPRKIKEGEMSDASSAISNGIQGSSLEEPMSSVDPPSDNKRRLRDGAGILQTGSDARFNEQEECMKIEDKFEPPCAAHVATGPSNSAQKEPGRGNNVQFKEVKEKNVPTPSRKRRAPPSNPASHKASKISKPPCASHVACDPSTSNSASLEEGKKAIGVDNEITFILAKDSNVQSRKRRTPSSTSTSCNVPKRVKPSSSTADETSTLVDSYCWTVKEFEDLWQNYLS
ncbi:Hypothetical predicted protein [Cloeon dipterum]|uniref:Uncharacterized protein n=1 Tax=Cloeon dipterum TaxID=197152 RepID=A0A8S1CLT5_9INSE|nr:Hypothetical predicted protein [Cloeon dipterum]